MIKSALESWLGKLPEGWERGFLLGEKLEGRARLNLTGLAIPESTPTASQREFLFICLF